MFRSLRNSNRILISHISLPRPSIQPQMLANTKPTTFHCDIRTTKRLRWLPKPPQPLKQINQRTNLFANLNAEKILTRGFKPSPHTLGIVGCKKGVSVCHFQRYICFERRQIIPLRCQPVRIRYYIHFESYSVR